MDIIARATVLYFMILLITRALGRRELSEMSPFELLVLVVVGDLIQQGVTQEDYSLTGAVLSVGTIALWSLVLSYLTYRWLRLHEVIQGVPALVYGDGKPLEDVLHTQRLELEDLLEAAREQGIGDLSELEYAVLEADGRFSFVKRNGGDHQEAKRHIAAE
jgi:uncharacterized membrane protein YcaP (DUF421 family)